MHDQERRPWWNTPSLVPLTLLKGSALVFCANGPLAPNTNINPVGQIHFHFLHVTKAQWKGFLSLLVKNKATFHRVSDPEVNNLKYPQSFILILHWSKTKKSSSPFLETIHSSTKNTCGYQNKHKSSSTHLVLRQRSWKRRRYKRHTGPQRDGTLHRVLSTRLWSHAKAPKQWEIRKWLTTVTITNVH